VMLLTFVVIREFGVYTVSGTWMIQVVEGKGDMLINQREPMILQRSRVVLVYNRGRS
jgi:uncharacterized protein (DUF779 family)